MRKIFFIGFVFLQYALLAQVSPTLVEKANAYLPQSPDSALDILKPLARKMKKIDWDNIDKIRYYQALGDAYYYSSKIKKAVKMYEKSLGLLQKSATAKTMIKGYYNLATLMYEQNQYRKAIVYYKYSLEYAIKINDLNYMSQIYNALSVNYEELSSYKKALDYHKRFIQTQNNLLNIETTKKITFLKEKYKKVKREKEKKEVELKKTTKELVVTKKDNEELAEDTLYKSLRINSLSLQKRLQELEVLKKEAENKAQREYIQYQHTIIIYIIIIIIVILLAGVFLLILYRKNKKAYRIIAQQNKNITESITYAKTIQDGVLPWPETIRKSIEEFFVFYKPRDIVSGDFYWVQPIDDDKVYVAVADCTGHGVPGALMSMLGVAFLSDIVNRSDRLLATNEVLATLRSYIKLALKDKQDGMDMALILYDKKTRILEYSGANRPLLLYRKEEKGYKLYEYKPTPLPVGRHPRDMRPYKSKKIELQEGDVIYLFSDGFVDQMGGPEGDKYMKKRLKELLMELQTIPIEQHYSVLERELQQWMYTEEKEYKQIDDVLVFGMKIS